jgi:hypothetical protein
MRSLGGTFEGRSRKNRRVCYINETVGASVIAPAGPNGSIDQGVLILPLHQRVRFHALRLVKLGNEAPGKV